MLQVRGKINQNIPKAEPGEVVRLNPELKRQVRGTSAKLSGFGQEKYAMRFGE
jgi:hypothetical protein